MTIPVVAPRLLLYRNECNNHEERRFLERLNERAEQGGWRAESWSHTTDHVLIVISHASHNNREPRCDYFGNKMLLGGDETGQYVTELDPASPDVTLITSGSPEEMADIAANWFEDHLPDRRTTNSRQHRN